MKINEISSSIMLKERRYITSGSERRLFDDGWTKNSLKWAMWHKWLCFLSKILLLQEVMLSYKGKINMQIKPNIQYNVKIFCSNRYTISCFRRAKLWMCHVGNAIAKQIHLQKLVNTAIIHMKYSSQKITLVQQSMVITMVISLHEWSF